MISGQNAYEWMTPNIFENPQPTDLYKATLQVKNLPLVMESVMKGVVSGLLEEKLNQKFEPIESRLAKIEETLSKKHIIGVNNLILSDKVIDEIWDEEDDTI